MLTIGEFSKLCRVSSRMLRHYDRIGLLRPCHIGQSNGYRYYDASQLRDAARIETLKNYGFSLAEIAQLLPLTEGELAQRVHARRIKAYAQLNDLRRTIRRMENDIIKMEGLQLAQEKYHVIVMDAPQQQVFGIRRTINVAQTHDLFQELYKEMERRGLKRSGATQLLYHGKEFNYEHMDVEAQAQVSGGGEGVTTIPAGLYLAVTHTGPYEEVHFAYDAVAAYLAQHPQYKVCGPSIERYIKDEDMVKSPEELETGVLFPVERVAE